MVGSRADMLAIRVDRVWNHHLCFWGNHKHGLVCMGWGQQVLGWQYQDAKVEAAPWEWAPRPATNEQVTLEFQWAYLQNERLDFQVELPTFKYQPGHLSEQQGLRWETEFFALFISLICKTMTRAKCFHCGAAAQTQCWQPHLAHGGNSKRKMKRKMVTVKNPPILKKKKSQSF